jgi:hypothetical protein
LLVCHPLASVPGFDTRFTEFYRTPRVTRNQFVTSGAFFYPRTVMYDTKYGRSGTQRSHTIFHTIGGRCDDDFTQGTARGVRE